MPLWFFDHHDSEIMNIDVTRIGSISYQKRLEARLYHECKREAQQKMAERYKWPRVVDFKF